MGTEEALGRSLLEAFAKVPDPRKARGRRHPLPAMLALSIAAMLSKRTWSSDGAAAPPVPCGRADASFAGLVSLLRHVPPRHIRGGATGCAPFISSHFPHTNVPQLHWRHNDKNRCLGHQPLKSASSVRQSYPGRAFTQDRSSLVTLSS